MTIPLSPDEGVRAATSKTCAHFSDHNGGKCVWHTRTWSQAPDVKPKRCAGCPDREISHG